MSSKEALSLAKNTYGRWSEHNAPRLGASVAFYSILSFAPLLVLMTAVIGLVFGRESANGALVNEARQVMGAHGAETVESLLKNAQHPASGIFASLVAFVTLLFGASGVFTELQDALNIMWDVTKQNSSGLMGMVKQRLFSFGMVLSIGFLLLVSLVLSAGLAYVGHSFNHLLPLPSFVLEMVNFLVSFAAVTVLFALMFKYVPSVQVSWREVIVGALGTALLFTIGKFALGIYLGKASVGSTYGAAGSLVAVVVWIYYSAQIFFFGAEFTRVYADARRAQSKGTQPDSPRLPSARPSNAEGTVEHAPAPKSIAAAASASDSHKVSPPVQTLPPMTKPAEAPHLRVAPRAPAVRPQTPRLHFGPPQVDHGVALRITKPKLITAAAIGFVLGRVAWSVAPKAHEGSRQVR